MKGHSDGMDFFTDELQAQADERGAAQWYEAMIEQEARQAEDAARPCPHCEGTGFLEPSRFTGIEPTCNHCIEKELCPRCSSAMRVEYDCDGYPISATCTGRACGMVWEY